MWNNSCRTPTEAGRRPQISEKARNSPCTWVGQKKKEKHRDKRTGTGSAPLAGSCEGGKVSTHQGAPSLAEMGAGGGEASEPQRRAQQQECRGQSREIPAQRIGAEQHSPAREARLLTRRGGRGLGAEARLQRSDPRERTGVGCVNTAWRGLVRHS